MENLSATPKPKLYTCVMKCAICLRELGVAYHVLKTPGVRIDFSDCPLHKPLSRYGSLLEWSPEA
jgi:hypothetical protein